MERAYSLAQLHGAFDDFARHPANHARVVVFVLSGRWQRPSKCQHAHDKKITCDGLSHSGAVLQATSAMSPRLLRFRLRERKTPCRVAESASQVLRRASESSRFPEQSATRNDSKNSKDHSSSDGPLPPEGILPPG